jgi:hypothetical protein
MSVALSTTKATDRLMTARVYLSNIVAAWPIERQEKLCAEKVPGWPDVAIYREEVAPRHRKSHSAEALVERNNALLRKTNRRGAETIYVPTLPLLGWELRDFHRCLVAAEARNATIVALDTGTVIPPNASRKALADAGDEFVNRRKSVQTEGARGTGGGKIAGERRWAAAEERCQKIAARWPLPSDQYPTAALLKEAGLSRNTVKIHLGVRSDAQERHRRSLAQGEINHKRRKSAT